MRTFHASLSVDVPASKPHPPNTAYRVSIGIEYWGETTHEVSKVQMAYEGVVSGRKSPSYPAHTDDYLHVMQAIARLERLSLHKPMSRCEIAAMQPDSLYASRVRNMLLDEKIDEMLDSVVNKAKSTD